MNSCMIICNNWWKCGFHTEVLESSQNKVGKFFFCFELKITENLSKNRISYLAGFFDAGVCAHDDKNEKRYINLNDSFLMICSLLLKEVNGGNMGRAGDGKIATQKPRRGKLVRGRPRDVFRTLMYLQHDELLPRGYRFKDDGLLQVEFVEIQVTPRSRLYLVEDSSLGLSCTGRGTTVRQACKDYLEVVVDAYEEFKANPTSLASSALQPIGLKIEEYIEKAA